MPDTARVYRGSRKHVLDWTGQPGFIEELLEMVNTSGCGASSATRWQPMGHAAPMEARLERFGPGAIPGHPAWPALRDWWLKHKRGANTPNWDIAVQCEIEGKPGLILVEAKANVPELSAFGKRPDPDPSPRSTENHDHIGDAIKEARAALTAHAPGIGIGRDQHYQLSNRLAFGWKLASLGIPTVLLYLGFTGDEGIRDAGQPFEHDRHWRDVFTAHLNDVCPSSILDRPLEIGLAKLWVLERSRPRLEDSPEPIPGGIRR
jgi:hypothetical protein